MKTPKKIIIKKQGTSSDYTTSEYYKDNDDNEDISTYPISDTSDNKNIKNIQSKQKSKSKPKDTKDPKFKSIVSSNYRKPRYGTTQDNYTKDDIIKHLKGFIPLTTMEEKKILTELPIFRAWIKYINVNTKQFRMGGFLMKVQYPDYIMLANPRTKVSWSVQLNNTIIYIRDPRDKETTNDSTEYYDTDTYYTETQTETGTTANEIEMIKDKLYKLYLNGQLTAKKK